MAGISYKQKERPIFWERERKREKKKKTKANIVYGGGPLTYK